MCVIVGYVMLLARKNSNSRNEQIKSSDLPYFFFSAKKPLLPVFVCLSRHIQLIYQKICFVFFPFCTNNKTSIHFDYLLNLFHITILFGAYLSPVHTYLIFSLFTMNRCMMTQNAKS